MRIVPQTDVKRATYHITRQQRWLVLSRRMSRLPWPEMEAIDRKSMGRTSSPQLSRAIRLLLHGWYIAAGEASN